MFKHTFGKKVINFSSKANLFSNSLKKGIFHLNPNYGKAANNINSSSLGISDPEVLRKMMSNYGITAKQVYHNLTIAELYEKEIFHSSQTDPEVLPNFIASNGAMVAYSGKKHGRSPLDKRTVRDSNTENDIWWGSVNIELSPKTFKNLENRAVDYLCSKERIYVVDGYAGHDKNHRIKVRIITCRSYHAHFMRNMLIVPTAEELHHDFTGNNEPDYVIINAGEMFAGDYTGVTSKTSVALNFSQRKMIILGTQYAGEMKKGVFSIMNYLMPKRGNLSLHSSATEGPNGDVTLYFGLSGTGKTTLSADPNRLLIGDDEHVWTSSGIFNIEGGCYAKVIGLNAKSEPLIFNAIKFGAILENVRFKDLKSREVDYNDTFITENIRVSYPLDHIPNAKIPAVGGHPKNILFLTCDSFGVLPPVSRLNHSQAMYHFISGYTAKVAGTEIGVKEPKSTFSACFGEAFLPLHPMVYAELLSKYVQKHNTKVWLINTGWTGGKYGTGKRMSLENTRKIIDCIHDGSLAEIPTYEMDYFGLQIPETCPGVDTSILNPKDAWHNAEEYDSCLRNLAKQFIDNFSKYHDKATEEVINAGPRL